MLIGISDASRGKMSGLHNSLIMGGKLANPSQGDATENLFSVAILGQKPHGIVCGYAICPLFVKPWLRGRLSMNNIQMDEKELEMLTKGLYLCTSHKS